jgi:putative acetyltransferase
MMQVQAEQPQDIAAIRQVHLAAFGRSGEADLVDRLRGQASTFSFVVVESAQIIAHIFFSPVTIEGECSADLFMLGLAPVAVLPAYQRQGVGTLLIRQSLADCARCGCQAIAVLGWPAYYPRFGFIPAKSFGLSCEYHVSDEAFMVLELVKGSLAGCRGIVKYQPEFNELGG